MSENTPRFETQAIHGRGRGGEGPVAAPIVASATYRFNTIEDLSLANDGKARGDQFYTRYGSPNLTSVEERLTALEGGERSLMFTSGMAAITAAFFAFLRPGARIVAQKEIYGGTYALIQELFVPWGVKADFVSIEERGGFEKACLQKADVVYTETPANPLCKIVNLKEVSAAAARAGAIHVCDATFASPYNQKTLQFGVDVVLHSATKYLGGHSDILAGAAIGPFDLIAKIEKIRRRTGAVPDPELSWRLERSLKTLALRVEQQNRAALVISQFLSTQQKIENVYYPGLPSHPDHEIARRQMTGFGGMLAFDVRGGEPGARRFADALKIIAIAPSLGGVESLISSPLRTSHAMISADERRRQGITDGTLRLSCGAENINDLLDDIKQALAFV